MSDVRITEDDLSRVAAYLSARVNGATSTEIRDALRRYDTAEVITILAVLCGRGIARRVGDGTRPWVYHKTRERS